MDLSHYKLGQQKPRKELIKMFVEKLNADRAFNKMKPLPPSFFAVRMSMLKVWELEAFWKECWRAENFSRYWWGKTKV
jgi:hypothetical protein